MKTIKWCAAWIICAAALAMVGCTTAYTTAAASLTAAERTVQAASEQFPAFDDAKRKDIVMKASSREGGAKALAEWSATAERIAKAVEGAHASVRLGADGLKGVRDGLRSPKDIGIWIGSALRVGLDLYNLLSSVGLNLQGVR